MPIRDRKNCTTLLVGKDVYRPFKKICVLNEKTCSSVMEKLILQYVKKECKRLGLELKEETQKAEDGIDAWENRNSIASENSMAKGAVNAD